MPEAGSGLLGSARRLLSTLTSIASTRLELLANELQEERLRLTQMLFFTLAALFCFGMGVLLLTVFIVLLFQDEYRLVAVAVLCVLFFVAGTMLWMLLRGKAGEGSRLFSASLAELDKDRQHLDGANE
ncbi:MAG: hypothetical protein A2Z95_07840 [Gallionellales bacterium GWA2_60_18]|nr:MAG: hypothetical protein A2Z95_07840 [Gallionellales bacterium GWA2_60_18]